MRMICEFVCELVLGVCCYEFVFEVVLGVCFASLLCEFVFLCMSCEFVL